MHSGVCIELVMEQYIKIRKYIAVQKYHQYILVFHSSQKIKLIFFVVYGCRKEFDGNSHAEVYEYENKFCKNLRNIKLSTILLIR